MDIENEQDPKLMRGPWSMLAPHHRRQALFLVSPPVDLPTAATAMVEDQSRVILAWMSSGHITRATDELVAGLGPEQEFDFMIVQPFVLVAFNTLESE